MKRLEDSRNEPYSGPIKHAEWYLLGLAAVLMVLVFILAALSFYT